MYRWYFATKGRITNFQNLTKMINNLVVFPAQCTVLGTAGDKITKIVGTTKTIRTFFFVSFVSLKIFLY